MNTQVVKSDQKQEQTFDTMVLNILKTKSGKKSQLTRDMMSKHQVPKPFRPLCYPWYYYQVKQALKRLRDAGHDVSRVRVYR